MMLNNTKLISLRKPNCILDEFYEQFRLMIKYHARKNRYLQALIEKLDDYISIDKKKWLEQALPEMEMEKIINNIRDSWTNMQFKNRTQFKEKTFWKFAKNKNGCLQMLKQIHKQIVMLCFLRPISLHNHYENDYILLQKQGIYTLPKDPSILAYLPETVGISDERLSCLRPLFPKLWEDRNNKIHIQNFDHKEDKRDFPCISGVYILLQASRPHTPYGGKTMNLQKRISEEDKVIDYDFGYAFYCPIKEYEFDWAFISNLEGKLIDMLKLISPLKTRNKNRDNIKVAKIDEYPLKQVWELIQSFLFYYCKDWLFDDLND